MPYPTMVRLIQRRRFQQWYVNFPAAATKIKEVVRFMFTLEALVDIGA
jgi:hypothetical protein